VLLATYQFPIFNVEEIMMKKFLYCIFVASLCYCATWDDITNPDLPITLSNSFTVPTGYWNPIEGKSNVWYFRLYNEVITNGGILDLGRYFSREEINLKIIPIYNAILAGRITNYTHGTVPVKNFRTVNWAAVASGTNNSLTVNDLTVISNAYLPSPFTLGGDLDMNGYNITNMAEPTVDSHAATKGYVDGCTDYARVTALQAATNEAAKRAWVQMQISSSGGAYPGLGYTCGALSAGAQVNSYSKYIGTISTAIFRYTYAYSQTATGLTPTNYLIVRTHNLLSFQDNNLYWYPANYATPWLVTQITRTVVCSNVVQMIAYSPNPLTQHTCVWMSAEYMIVNP
jgi:hypothetical protein